MSSLPPPPPGVQQTQQQKQQQAKQIQDGVTAVTNGLIGALNALGVQNAKALQPFGTLIGTIAAAEVAGTLSAITVVGALGAFAASLYSLLNQGADETQQVATQLEAMLNSIGARDANTSFQTRQGDIQKALAPATAVLASLQSWAANPPADFDDELGKILTAISTMAPPQLLVAECTDSGPLVPGLPDADFWMVYFPDQVYWNDSDAPAFTQSFYGQQAPSPDGSNNVFTYTFILPSYLSAVSIFLSVGAVIDPNFKNGYSEIIGQVACWLQSMHDYIYNQGFVQLYPSTGFDAQILTGWFNSFSSAPHGVSGLNGYNPVGDEFNEYLGGVSIEYGTVEKFSGYSSVNYANFVAPFNAGYDYEGKFLIRLRKTVKDVYQGVGLLDVLNTINSLNTILGKAPPTGATLADWSVRRDLSIGGVVQNDGSVHLRDVANLLLDTPPADIPQIPSISFRNMLDIVPVQA